MQDPWTEEQHKAISNALFDEAIKIAKQPMIRGFGQSIREHLKAITNKWWKDEWVAANKVPEWYLQAVTLRCELEELLGAYLLKAAMEPNYVTARDLEKLAQGKTPAHLKNWAEKWHTEVIPKIHEMRKKALA